MKESANWLLTARDVSATVTIRDEPAVWLGMMFEMSDSSIRMARTTTSGPRAIDETVAGALEDHRGPTVIGVDARLPQALAKRVHTALTAAGCTARVETTELPDWAEDTVVDLLDHLSGRGSPKDRVEPENWAQLHRQARQYLDSTAWERRADDVHLRLDLKIGAERSEWVAVVTGAAGISRGLVLFPGGHVTDAPTAGTIHLSIGGTDVTDMPQEHRDRAVRYGWPAGGHAPVFIELTDDGPCALSRRGSMVLTLALAAVIDHDNRSLSHGDGAVTGEMIMSNGRRGRYRAWLEAASPPPTGDELRVFAGEVRDDLLPIGTVTGLGGMPWENLATVRAHARFRLDTPQPRDPAGDGLPLVLISLPRSDAESVAAQIQAALPEGVALLPHGNETLVVLVGETIHGLFAVPTADPAMQLFERRLRATAGWHGIVLMAEGEDPPKCTVAFFEFALEGLPAHSTPRPTRTPPRKGSRRRRK